jgi:hypothetical protein
MFAALVKAKTKAMASSYAPTPRATPNPDIVSNFGLAARAPPASFGVAKAAHPNQGDRMRRFLSDAAISDAIAGCLFDDLTGVA